MEEFFYGDLDGYFIKTDKTEVFILISSLQHCCEKWGYLSSDDDLSLFIGAKLQDVKLTDKALNQEIVEKSGYYEYAGGIQFVDFITNKGTFQIAVYNSHNGYYGHDIFVIMDKVIYEGRL